MTIAVIGGGIQGCLAAIELELRGHQVVLFERDQALMMGASRWNEGKIHLGYLFAKDPSLRTARALVGGATRFSALTSCYLERSLDFVARSSRFVYAVHRRSLTSTHQIERHLGRVHALVTEALGNSRRDYLGRRRLAAPHSSPPHAHGLDDSHVAAAFVTDELSIDSQALADAITLRTTAAPRIEALHGRQVASIVRRDDGRFVLNDMDGCRHGPFDQVVNAAWEQRLGLDRSLGYEPPVPWMHRFKLALHVGLSAGLRDLPTVTFVLGPYGDVVNFGGTRAYLSWYPVSRIASSTALVPPAMDAAVEAARRDGVSRAIVGGLTDLLPGLAQLQPSGPEKELNGGYIFAWGDTDIDDAGSGLHRRYDIGVHSDGGYHSIDTGKLTMAPLNAATLGERIGDARRLSRVPIRGSIA